MTLTKAIKTNKLLIIKNKQDSDKALQEQIEKFKEIKTLMEEKTNELDKKINENASAIAAQKVALEKIINKKEEDAKLREKKIADDAEKEREKINDNIKLMEVQRTKDVKKLTDQMKANQEELKRQMIK